MFNFNFIDLLFDNNFEYYYKANKCNKNKHTFNPLNKINSRSFVVNKTDGIYTKNDIIDSYYRMFFKILNGYIIFFKLNSNVYNINMIKNYLKKVNLNNNNDNTITKDYKIITTRSNSLPAINLQKILNNKKIKSYNNFINQKNKLISKKNSNVVNNFLNPSFKLSDIKYINSSNNKVNMNDLINNSNIVKSTRKESINNASNLDFNFDNNFKFFSNNKKYLQDFKELDDIITKKAKEEYADFDDIINNKNYVSYLSEYKLLKIVKSNDFFKVELSINYLDKLKYIFFIYNNKCDEHNLRKLIKYYSVISSVFNSKYVLKMNFSWKENNLYYLKFDYYKCSLKHIIKHKKYVLRENIVWGLLEKLILSLRHLSKYNISLLFINPSNVLYSYNYNFLLSFHFILDMKKQYSKYKKYIAPELLSTDNNKNDINFLKCDIYSIGKIILEIITNSNNKTINPNNTYSSCLTQITNKMTDLSPERRPTIDNIITILNIN